VAISVELIEGMSLLVFASYNKDSSEP